MVICSEKTWKNLISIQALNIITKYNAHDMFHGFYTRKWAAEKVFSTCHGSNNADLKAFLFSLSFVGEYEESKSFEVFRRYNKLKGMIKRTVMYTRLGVVPDVSSAIGLGGLMLVNTSSNRWQGIGKCKKV